MQQSFSVKVKEDLCQNSIKNTHCATAELAGIIHACGTFSLGAGGMSIKVSTENKNVVNRVFSLVKKLYSMDCQLTQSSSQLQKEIYQVRIQPPEFSAFLADMAIPFGFRFTVDHQGELFSTLIDRDCCQCAYLRGAILGGGIISDPEKNYHMEFVSGTQATAFAVIHVLSLSGISAKCLERKNGFSAYLKDAQSISETLTLAGTHSCVLALENARMIKDIRNNVNRQVNFENANIDKVVNAGMSQTENIQLIEDHLGLENLSPSLREAAELRLQNPEASLSDLAALSGISKSGINNRLRKLAEIADSYRTRFPEEP